jgi:3-phosphoshikimate 1-carboxyvinyltransferase
MQDEIAGDKLEIKPCGPVSGSIRPPGSKSITNRALVCAALAQGESTLTGALDSEDTRVMIDSLRTLGLTVEHDRQAAAIRISGCGGRLPSREADLYAANSGTTLRFITALATLGNGRFRLDGSERMRQRPVQDLLDALRQLGADVESELGTGCPPVVVRASGLPGGRAVVSGAISSQFLSGLLLSSPYARRPVELVVDGALVSQPYVSMTIAVMAAFGGRVETENLSAFVVPGQQSYRGRVYAVEPDASAASYFFATAAITGGQVTVEGLSRSSLQGDVAFCDCLRSMGCDVKYRTDSISVAGRPLRGVAVNMNAISDTVQTLAAVAVFADGPTTITGAAHIRHKETDRLGALAAELRKLGATVDETADGLRIVPAKLRGAEIETYNDHRMAMALALVGLSVPGVVILNPGCVGKTYPGFFADLRGITTNRSKGTGTFFGRKA